jgi:predicted metalloprotease with PDZ domain
MRKRNPGGAWLGDLRLESRDGWRVTALVAPTWPIYAAGVDEDDELQQVDGQKIAGRGDITTLMQRHKPGDTVPVVFVDRTGVAKTASVTLAEDPHTEVVPVSGAALTAAQKAFRDRWLEAK